MFVLRYLAADDSQATQSFTFRVSRATVSKIIRETCEGIWAALEDVYMKVPNRSYDWIAIATDFEEQWNFPNSLGALDGKHVNIICLEMLAQHSTTTRIYTALYFWLYVMQGILFRRLILAVTEGKMMQPFCNSHCLVKCLIMAHYLSTYHNLEKWDLQVFLMFCLVVKFFHWSHGWWNPTLDDILMNHREFSITGYQGREGQLRILLVFLQPDDVFMADQSMQMLRL